MLSLPSLKMAEVVVEEDVTAVIANREPGQPGLDCGSLRRCRGRPRLPDSDRARRRLESRKKYDVRRVYLGESHRLWSELRRRTSLSDAGLAEYLVELHARYGQTYRDKYGSKLLNQESCQVKLKKAKKHNVNCLRSLVSWYQEHKQTCSEEPQLRLLEPIFGFSTTAVWQCEKGHSYMQHLRSPEKDATDSENEADMDGTSGEKALQAEKGRPLCAKKQESVEHVKNSSQECGTFEDIRKIIITEETEEQQITLLTALNGLPSNCPMDDQQVSAQRHTVCAEHWHTELTVPKEASGKSLEDPPLKQEKTGSSGESLATASVAADLGCVVLTASQNSGSVDEQPVLEEATQEFSSLAPLTPPSSMQLADPAELYEPPTLRTVVASCQIPDGEATIDGSQVIIITESSYEALTSEGIHLNVEENVSEEMTCTVIEGVSYNQVCESDADPCENMDSIGSIGGVEDKSLQENAVLTETSIPEVLSRAKAKIGSQRSKKSKRGPVIEADGMPKMFHCPYEGCSLVYVSISSFQNHINLVHRKGRTKVCPQPGCGKKFYLSNHLHRHMIIHSGVRDFICETCGKSFKRKNHLEVHRRTHTGETPLQCEICGYQCRQRASLNWHMKKHTPEVQYNFTCEHCGKRFEKLESVKFHKLKSHPEMQVL
ncbi:zinc finger protein 653 [Polypterus senegalus]|uniref:zinc finger protein 653 n=1 Tax=Polypterus senegalus TaxID=55291 RepID=UPI001962E499|nr:zinc finger protein 653 [Polypterus senegalus]